MFQYMSRTRVGEGATGFLSQLAVPTIFSDFPCLKSSWYLLRVSNLNKTCSSTCQGLEFVLVRKVFLRSLLCLKSFLISPASSPYGRNYPPHLLPKQKKQLIKLVKIRKIQKHVFGQKIVQAGNSYETLQMRVNSSRGTKTKLLNNEAKQTFRKRTNSQMYCTYQYFGLLRLQQCKNDEKS